MGIQGLIPLLEKSWTTVNVSQFSGSTAAIDAYCWLHRGVYTCAEKLARGDDCQAYVHYCMRFVSMLLAHNIKPILVFDGQHLPAKADTESKRRKQREENRRKAAELMRLDKGKEASVLLRRSIDVTHKMALNLIKRCREINVDCIVAPYEADSQLAYLNLSGIAHIVITEDSDLLLFGCKRVLFKLDQNGGGILIEQNKLYLSMNTKPEHFSFDKFRYMCILSGCDYLPSVPGVGLIKARQFVSRTSDPDIYNALSRLGSFMNIKVPLDYRLQFMEADRMFQYQPVYDPRSRKVIPLNKILDPNISVLESKLTPDQAYQLALGNMDPISLVTMDDWSPDARTTPKNKVVQARHKSIWSNEYQTSNYEPYICNLVKNTVKTSPPTVCSKITKKVTLKLPKEESPTLKKIVPVSEENILSTLEEIYSLEQESEEDKNNVNKKYPSRKSLFNNCEEIDKNIITPEIDNIIVESETPNVFKQSSKRKYTVINPEKQIVSGYFSAQLPKSNESFVEEKEDEDEEKCFNPFKRRKKFVINKKSNETHDVLSASLNTSHPVEENYVPQIIEDKEVAVEKKTSVLDQEILSTIQKSSFSWKSYSNNISIAKHENPNKETSYDGPNESISVNNDIIKIDDDVDEGFCSQSTKESNVTSNQVKRSCPRTGLSRNIVKKNGQTLLSKFGFKTNNQLKW